MKTILVKVSNQDIANAFDAAKQSGSILYKSCPIAQALNRMEGFYDAGVTRKNAHVTNDNGVRLTAPLTERAKAFVLAFDALVDGTDDEPVYPSTFRLTFW